MNSSHFVKEKKLGAGAFGVVYRVRSKRSNNLYVIKEQQMSSPAVMNEVEVLKKMRPHSNVVAYHGFWFENGKGCILMEYASRGSLDDILKLCAGPMSENDALYLFAQIVLGVNHIHRQSIIHRDLKPANVMLHRVSNANGMYMDVIKIGDFGISKDTGVSIARTAVGTKIYMAPETFRGRGYNSKCDMWSCGIILYELLTNDFPFIASTPREMMSKIQQGRVARITSGNITERTLEMTYKLLSVNPDERPRSTHLVRIPTIANCNRNIRHFLGDNSTTPGETSDHSLRSLDIGGMIATMLREAESGRRQRAMQHYHNREEMREMFPHIFEQRTAVVDRCSCNRLGCFRNE